jgi:serine/threonine-protein kinase HipA
MALYLVGENLDKTRSHYRAETGALVQLMRGIYVDPSDDVEQTVLRHAVRIAKYLYPNAYLSAASAALLGPTKDGRLFISARRKQRTRIRSLEIIQNVAPKHPSVSPAIINDGMGEFHINVSSIRQRFLEAFRLRSEHAASLDIDARAALAARLVEEYGGLKEAADAVWSLARENEWYREGELAERFILKPPTATIRNESAIDLVVAWHAKPIGNLRHDGFEWRWYPAEDSGPPLVRQTTPGKLPPFITSLMPEGWLEDVLKNKDERALLRSGKRYTSNITIVENANELKELPDDFLLTRLESHQENGVFTGNYSGPGRTDIDQTFERNLARIYERADTPRLSGIQIKAPMCLDANGTLSPSTGKPFTHILKPAGTGGYEFLPLIEWVAMELGRAAGFETPSTALVPMPDHMRPALLVERFDIRRNRRDKRMLAMEDLCSVLDLPKEAKYDGTMERVARGVRSLSTAPDEDVLTVVRRAFFAWIIADGDMHLKNMALLKTAEPGDKQFRSVRMAPLYDAVTTRVFPNLKHDRMALKLNGKDHNLRRNDFRTLATTAGLKSSEADTAIDDIVRRMQQETARIALPETLELGDEEQKVVKEMIEICNSRAELFG